MNSMVVAIAYFAYTLISERLWPKFCLANKTSDLMYCKSFCLSNDSRAPRSDNWQYHPMWVCRTKNNLWPHMSSQLSPTARCEGRFLMGSVDHKIALDLASSGEILYDWRMSSALTATWSGVEPFVSTLLRRRNHVLQQVIIATSKYQGLVGREHNCCKILCCFELFWIMIEVGLVGSHEVNTQANQLLENSDEDTG